jgi:Na+-translocating ferredoxin:NAD+ oxidoreductase RnfD subunit
VNVTVAADGTAARSLRIGRASYPLVLPSRHDARLHLATVILSIHVLGQVAFDFRVTVVQILAAILTAAAIEAAVIFSRDRRVVWPASAMLTGSGVALVLRDANTEAGDPWGTQNWYLFAGVSALALATKYLIRWRGQHVFNPSNVALVAAFVVLGSDRAEPLDFWWAPFDVWIAVAYALILFGGVRITRRLRLFEMAAGYWVALAAAVGVLSWSGHAITTTWSVAPVGGLHFWWTILSSPEVLIFLFFMLTDPKTVPAGRVARVVFGVGVGVLAALLMAPQDDEFGTKVALLAALSIACPCRWVLARAMPTPVSVADGPREFVADVFGARATNATTSLWTGVARLACIVPLVVVPIAWLGSGARSATVPAPSELPDPATIVPRVHLATPLAITMDGDLGGYARILEGGGARLVVEALYWDLAIEAEALRRGDANLLRAADHGARLASMQDRLLAGDVEPVTYDFDAIHIGDRRLGGQSAPVLTIQATGRATSGGHGIDVDITFALRHIGTDRWLIVAILE